MTARLDSVRAQIAAVARRCGREPSEIRLVAVSKTKPVALIREAYEAGQRDFGENYIQELAQKAEALQELPELRFHFIGHLQRNKAKIAARIASTVHTLDSPRLAAELGKRMTELISDPQSGKTSPLTVLVEVNVGGEVQKSGCNPGDLEAVLAAIEREPSLRLSGLMMVPPFTEDPNGARPFFENLVRLREAHGGVARLPELSIGMTRDLVPAIEVGATIVRVGTAIFGERT